MKRFLAGRHGGMPPSTEGVAPIGPRRRVTSIVASLAILASAIAPALTIVAATSSPAGAATASISLAKSSSISSFSSSGTSVTYSYKVTNTGSTSLKSVGVTDPMSGLSTISCPGTTLSVGANLTCTATYTTTQADVDHGSISNTGTATATPTSGGSAVTAKSSVTIPATQTPAIGITKTANVQSYSAAGTVITYSYALVNSGNVTLTNATVTDNKLASSSINCNSTGTNKIASLAPNATGTCTASYTTTAADVTAGSITNIGTVTAKPPTGSNVTSNSSLTIPASGQPFTCTTPTDFLSQGNPDTQLYYSTTGSGSVTYNTLGSAYDETYNALGWDPLSPAASPGFGGYLFSTELSGNTLYKIDSAGAVTSLGTISGYSANSNQPADGGFDSAGYYWITGGNGSTTAYAINVTTSPPKVVDTVTLTGHSWEPIDWTLVDGYFWGLSGTTIYRVQLPTVTAGTTTGSAAVSEFTAPSGVTSGNFGAAWTFSNGNLGFSNNGNGDIYQISVANPSGTPTFTIVSSYTGPVAGSSNDGAACIGQDTDLGIVKSGPATVDPGGTVNWQLTVTNYGPGNSSGFAVDDTVPSGYTGVSSSTAGCTVTGNAVLCSEGALTNGNTFVINLSATAPATDGTCLTNTATVTANETDPNPANNTSSLQTCTAPSVSIVKSASPTYYSAAGQQITYSYLVTNTSTSEALTNVTVTDPMTGLSAISCPGGNPLPELDAGASVTCTATYTTTAADVTSKSISNTGTVTATPPSGSNLTASSSLVVPYAAITVAKSASVSSYASAGTPITYSYLVTNTGNSTLNSVGVTDPMPGLSAVTCPDSTLAAGASETCTATYTTTQADVDAGSISNTGTASGTPPGGSALTATSSLTIPASGATSSLSLVKSTTSSGFGAAGASIPYSYLVKNTGTTTISSIAITDNKLATASITCPNSSLAPGASETCAGTYTTTQADVDAGSVTNTATAGGKNPSGGTVTSNPSSVTVPANSATSSLSLVKSTTSTGYAAAGNTIPYSYLVKNTGTTTISSIAITDNKLTSGITCPNSSLAPGASETCAGTYTVTQADVDAGSVTNTATAGGKNPSGGTVTSNPSSVTVDASGATSSLSLVKSTTSSGFGAAGASIPYSYLVKNTGTTTISSIAITDNKLATASITCPNSSLAPGASETCAGTYTTTQADVDAGSVTNTATAGARTPRAAPSPPTPRRSPSRPTRPPRA